MIPEPWKDNKYYKLGLVAEVPLSWLIRYQGNRLRMRRYEFEKLVEDIKTNGIEEPVMIFIGQKDRTVTLGEGNHRMMAAMMAGLKSIPARVIRNQYAEGVSNNKMSRVPVDDYFPADASPLDVFDEFE